VERDVIRSWLERLGNERLELKVRRFEARLLELIDESKMVAREPFPRYYGSPDEIPPPEKTYTRKDFAVAALWEQLLYEAVMEGFGYAKNNAAFLALAQSARLAILRQNNLEDRHMMQAMLFGAAGLLPVPRTVRDLEARKHVRELRRTWKSRRITFPGPLLHPAEWLFFRLRPANFPTARIAAMSHILPHLFGKGALQEIVAAFGKGSGRIPEHLLERFRFEPEEFWRHRCHFTRRNTSLGIQIGPARIHEILVNGVIPVLLLYARVFKDHELRRNALSVLSNMHSSQSNSVTRVMKEQLLKSRLSLKGALEEQGAIQLFKFYCQRDGCAECEIGRRVFQPET
jgi:hypothetical protein